MKCPYFKRLLCIECSLLAEGKLTGLFLRVEVHVSGYLYQMNIPLFPYHCQNANCRLVIGTFVVPYIQQQKSKLIRTMVDKFPGQQEKLGLIVSVYNAIFYLESIQNSKIANFLGKVGTKNAENAILRHF